MDDDVGIAGRLAAVTVGTSRKAADGITALGDDICIEPLDEDIDID